MVKREESKRASEIIYVVNDAFTMDVKHISCLFHNIVHILTGLYLYELTLMC